MELKNRSFQYGKVALAVRTQYHQLQFVLKVVASLLHRHLHVSCADHTFSAAAGLPVCRPCSVNLLQKSVQCWIRPVLIRKFLQQLSGTVTLTLPYNLDQYSVLLVKSITFYVDQTRQENVTNIMSLFVTLPAVSMLIGIFHWKILFLSSIF